MITLDTATTALILIDLQQGILAGPVAPHGAAELVGRAKLLAARFRAQGAPVFPVKISVAPDLSDAPQGLTDSPFAPPPGGFPANWSQLVDGVAAPGEEIILKRQWGAFYGTPLEALLRRRGVRTLVLAGVSTNFGVESTARQGFEFGFDIVIAEDACASRIAEWHEFSIRHILPRLARVVSCADVVFAAPRP